MWCFGGKHSQRQIGSRKPTARHMIGEHSELVTEQTCEEFECVTFSSFGAVFSVEFAQEVKAEVGFSPCNIGAFGQTGVFEFSLSFLSAKSFSHMAEQRSPLSSANTCSFWEIMLAAIGISNTTSSLTLLEPDIDSCPHTICSSSIAKQISQLHFIIEDAHRQIKGSSFR